MNAQYFFNQINVILSYKYKYSIEYLYHSFAMYNHAYYYYKQGKVLRSIIN